MAPGAFAYDVNVSGNGAFSDNNVSYSQSSRTNVTQSNSSNITNDVSVSNDTGGNSSSFNTGGNSTVQTGDAISRVTISNTGGTNIATLPSCGCNQTGGSISVTGNGAFSENRVRANSQNSVSYNQSNYSRFNNYVDVNNTTGNNKGGYNTSGWSYTMPQQNLWTWYQQHQNNNNWDFNQMNNWFKNSHSNFGGNSGGSNSVSTGDAISDVTIHNMGSQNILH